MLINHKQWRMAIQTENVQNQIVKSILKTTSEIAVNHINMFVYRMSNNDVWNIDWCPIVTKVSLVNRKKRIKSIVNR